MIYSNKLIQMTLFILTLSIVLIHLMPSIIEGRLLLLTPTDMISTSNSPKMSKEEKVMMIRGQIMGSRPPRCQGRCYSCGGHCVAVQVPSTLVSHLQYADYKPITWKCKCGSSLFNP